MAPLDTLQQMVATIRALVDQGAEDCVALGSDFDGPIRRTTSASRRISRG